MAEVCVCVCVCGTGDAVAGSVLLGHACYAVLEPDCDASLCLLHPVALEPEAGGQPDARFSPSRFHLFAVKVMASALERTG